MTAALPRAIGLGAGGNARSVLDALRLMGGVEVAGLLDNDPARHGCDLDGVAVLGGDALLPRLLEQGVTMFFLGVGGGGMAAGSGRIRRTAFQAAAAAGLRPLTVVHPSAVVSPRARLGAGACVLAGAVVNAGAVVAEGVLVNTGAIVEHDCVIGAFAHVATGARLAGAVTVGELAHVGAGAVVRQGLAVGAGAVVGISAAVVRAVAPGTVVAGVPARPLREDPLP